MPGQHAWLSSQHRQPQLSRGIGEHVVDFARALGSLLNDQPAIIRMGAAARERSEQFTWAATAEAFAEVLASATGQSTPHVSVAPAPSGHVEHHRPDDAWDQLSP